MGLGQILIGIQLAFSNDQTITGSFTWDRLNGGSLVGPAGAAFPGTPAAGEWFFRTDLMTLYRRNSGNTAWEVISPADGNVVHRTGDETVAGIKTFTSQLKATGTAVLGDSGCVASGTHSVAEGESSQATGLVAHTEGSGGVASGDYSHAEGFGPLATGIASHAEGYDSVAGGDRSHAEGDQTDAGGTSSHSEGSQSAANGEDSHAEGNTSTANGVASHAEGRATVADSDCAHCEGDSCHAGGVSSHAEGSATLADAWCAHAEGSSTQVTGGNSHAEGNGTLASAECTHAEGASTGAHFYAAHSEGEMTSADGEASHAEGLSTVASSGASHAEGLNTVVDGSSAHGEGSNCYAGGESSHAEGDSAQAAGRGSHAEGLNTAVIGDAGHAEGNSASAYYEAQSAHASGMFSEQGDAQASETVLRGITPGDNPGETVELHFGAGEDQILNLPGGRASLIMLEGVATDGGDHASFRQSFLVWRDSRHPIGHPSGINIVAHGAQENLYSPGAVSWTLVPNVVGSYWLRWFGIVFCTGVTTKKVHVVCNVRIVETTWRT